MLRQFRDPDGESIHFIAPGQEDSIQPDWVEIQVPTAPAQVVELPYFIKRMKEYPPISDQLDMLWHAMDKDEIPGKGSEWYESILAVKNAHPKP